MTDSCDATRLQLASSRVSCVEKGPAPWRGITVCCGSLLFAGIVWIGSEQGGLDI